MNSKILLSIVMFALCCHVNAQEDTATLGTAPQRFQRQEADFPDLRKTDKALTYDLTITSLSVGGLVSDHRNGTVITRREIKYTIKNTGTGSVPLNRVVVQGYIGDNDIYIPENMTPACGKIVNSGSATLAQGASYSSSYKCTVGGYWNNMKNYMLVVDQFNAIPETNENNNTKVIKIN